MKPAPVVILGGGCAGLSLARDLARAESSGASIPETIVLEPRPCYQEDRTWCFWAQGEDAYHPLIRHRWGSWRFSAGDEVEQHAAPDWHYCCVPSSVFYQDASDAIRGASHVRLETGVTVNDVRPSGEGLIVESTAGSLHVNAVIDTRPPRQEDRGQGFMQIFSGAVVEDGSAGHDHASVGLMEAMTCDEHGFRFDYVLPLGPDQRLIEATRFCSATIPEHVLEQDLEQAIDRVMGRRPMRIIRREQGAIPMGHVATTPVQLHPNWVYAGTRGGAVRASSGYAFRRIQTWAADCTSAIIEHGRPIGHPNEPRMRHWMDRLFLSVLRSHPERSPELFMRLARYTRPESLVRYLSDGAGVRDAWAVIRSLPMALFLRQWSQDFFAPPVRVA